MRARRRWLGWLIGGAVAAVVLVVAVPYVYIHFIEGPPAAPLSLKSRSGASPGRTSASGAASRSASTAVAGSWRVGQGSVVGYRVKEILVGQSNIAVGRTSAVTGHLAISKATVTAATFTVRMSTIHSDQSQRDAQFDGRIMDVAAYPTGGFTLTRPIGLAPLPAAGVIKTYSATGVLTLHGHSKQVTFTLSAERIGTAIRISGSIPVIFADWSIPNPSFGSFVTTQNHGILEFLLTFTKA